MAVNAGTIRVSRPGSATCLGVWSCGKSRYCASESRWSKRWKNALGVIVSQSFGVQVSVPRTTLKSVELMPFLIEVPVAGFMLLM